MSKLTEFLLETTVDNLTQDIVISVRLKDFPFKIKAMTGKNFREYSNMATKIGRHKNVSFDQGVFNEQVILNHTVEPNFRDAEFVAAFAKKNGRDPKTVTPEQVMYGTLLAGEIAELANKISELSGFSQDLEELRDEAKNS